MRRAMVGKLCKQRGFGVAVLLGLCLVYFLLVLYQIMLLRDPSNRLRYDRPITTAHFEPPSYFSILSLNLASVATSNLNALRDFGLHFQPDFFVLQQIPSSSRDLEILDQILAIHGRIEYKKTPRHIDESDRKEWQSECVVYFNRNVWNVTGRGVQAIGENQDGKARNLCWIRFQMSAEHNNSVDRQVLTQSILVTTVSLTPAGSEHEITTGSNPRIQQSDTILDTISKLRRDKAEAVLVVGDMGDDFSAKSIFEAAGLLNPFHRLSIPLAGTAQGSVRDWIFANNRVRPILADVVQVVPSFSTHRPVMAVYELLPCDTPCQSRRFRARNF